MTIGSLHFAAPLWLAAGAALGATGLFLELRLRRQRRVALGLFSSRLGSAAAAVSPARRTIKAGLLLLGVLCTCLALARPQLGYRVEETYQRGIDLMFVIDTSKSMLTPDIKPDRLTRAKLAIDDLVAKFPGDRVGLVAFAGDAFLQCPLTLDRAMFDQTLQAIDTGVIPRGGTDLGRGLDVATEALASQPANRKLVVVLSDGEDLEAHAIDEARAAGHAGVRIYTVGVGTPAGDLVPNGQGGFIRDASGAFVRSHLDEATLTKIAGATGGAYRPLGVDGGGLERLYSDVLDKLPRETLTERLHRIPLERFQWPLGLAAFCFIAEALMSERRRHKARHSSEALSAAAALGFLGLWSVGGTARASVRDAEQEYRAGKFKQSAGEYGRAAAKAPQDARLSLNAGAAAYKAGDFDAASTEIDRTLHRADRLDLQEPAYYDLGNTLYRIGQSTQKADQAKTIEQWKKSISAYDGALELNAHDADARFNRDLVQKKLAELMKQQQQKPQQKQDQKKQDQEKQSAGDQKLEPQGGAQQQAKNEQGGKPGQSGKPDHGQGQSQADGQKSSSQGAAQDQAKNGASKSSGQPSAPQPDASARNGQQHTGQVPTPQATPDRLPAGTQANSGPPAEADDSGERAQPGQLSRQDARALLDSLRGDERLFAAGPENGKQTPETPVGKDW